MRSLRQCLIDTELARLRVIARLWGLEVKAKRQLEFAAELAQALADPVHAADAWEALPDDERAALTALLDAGGQLSEAAFTRRFGGIRPIGPGRLERETPWRDPISPAEGLWYRGLIFEGFAGEAGETYPTFFVPAELRAAVPREERVSAVIQLEAAAPPAHPRFVGDLLMDDVTTVLTFLQNEVVKPGADSPGAWPERMRRELMRHLRDRDPERLLFIVHLIDQLEWTRAGEDGRLRLVAEPVATWLKGAAVESQAALVRAWREMVDWNELWRLPSLQLEDTGTWRNDPTLGRAALLRHLEALAPGEWVTMADFVSAIKTVDPDFQRPGGDYETWYIRDATSGEFLTGFESWDRVEGILLRALLTGPAWWLGLVELGSETEDGLPDLLRRRVKPGPGPSAEPTAVVRADLTIVMPATRRYERFQLARVADLVRVGDPYLYRLTPGSLTRARQQRIDLDRVLSFLGGLSDAPLPRAVRSGLERWVTQGTEVWLERTLLLRVAEEAVMRQIVASPIAGRYVGRTVTPTVAVVSEEDWPKLVDALAEMGLLVELVGVGNV